MTTFPTLPRAVDALREDMSAVSEMTTAELKEEVGLYDQRLYEIKQQLRADGSSGFPRGEEWRFRAMEAARHIRSERAPFARELDARLAPDREAKKERKRADLAAIAEVSSKTMKLKAFKAVAKEVLDEKTFQRICGLAGQRLAGPSTTLMDLGTDP